MTLKIFEKYKNFVFDNCMIAEGSEGKDVAYWKNYLFAKTMIFVIPLSLITLIPGILFCLYRGFYLLVAIDTLSFIVLLFVIFGSRLRIRHRKFLFILNAYFASFFLLMYSGASGPGLLILYASCIFGLLIGADKYAYFWSFLITGFAAAFTAVLHFNLSPVPEVNAFDELEWVATSVNAIFLSFLSSALIPRLFYGISETINSHNQMRDILAQKNFEQKELLRSLESKNEDLEQFAYVASHDLQEPLRMVSSFMNQLEKRYGNQLDEKAKEYIYFASDGAKRMSSIIRELLEYSRAGNLSGDRETLSLERLMNDYKISRNELIKETHAEILTGDLPLIKTFRTPIMQVLSNLLDNAIKYAKPGVKPEVYVNCADIDAYWEIRITDNGIGIKREHIEKIFGLFHRAANGLEQHGSGLGLAIVKKIIHRLGGKIWVESEPEVGTSFHFTIPK
ncbi:MAG TPA: ATP-binding protein [Cryomorphaceae bacterium]|nr:ATP-binding protein [Cryomorphaceae bacterium]